MNASLLCLIAALSADPTLDAAPPVYDLSSELEAAVRGQSPYYEGSDSAYHLTPSSHPPVQHHRPTPVVPVQQQIFPPNGGLPPLFSPQGQMMHDPFLGGAPPGAADPFGMGAGVFMPPSSPFSPMYGVRRMQPFRYGWNASFDVGYITRESADSPLGNFEVFELNTELRQYLPLGFNWLFSHAPQYNLRLWSGPEGGGLPGNVHRFGWDFELSTPANAPASVQLGFNPSFGTDFNRSPTSNAWMWDGRGALFLRPTPQWTLVLGAQYWDRVRDRVLPWAGAIWTPDDRWEFRLVFPDPRISYFLGNMCGTTCTWLYVRGEYHIENYEIVVSPPGMRDQIEIKDWRIAVGVQADSGFVAGFLEGGWVFDRDVRFRGPTPNFGINSGFMVRAGLSF